MYIDVAEGIHGGGDLHLRVLESERLAPVHVGGGVRIRRGSVGVRRRDIHVLRREPPFFTYSRIFRATAFFSSGTDAKPCARATSWLRATSS